MKTVYGYIRVSTVKQGEGVSLIAQKESITRYAENHNLKISEWFEEKETAAKQGRPLFTAMMKKLKAGKATGVIIHKIDRSARNLKDWAALGDLIDQGIEVHFAHESLDLKARGGRLSADIQAVIAADYIRNLREETKKGIYGRLQQGLYPFQAPVGYLDTGPGKVKEIDPVKGPLVRKAFELYATRKYSLEELVPIIYDLGLRNIRGGKVTSTGLSNILNNVFYMGIMKVGGAVFKGVHEPLVPPALFRKVGDILSGKTNEKTRNHEFVFRKMITCGLCGYSLVGEVQKGHTYYRCHTRDCPTKGFREKYLEAQVSKFFQLLGITEGEMTGMGDVLDTMSINEATVRQKVLTSVLLQKEQTEQKLERATDALLDGMIDRETYAKRKENILKQLSQFEFQEKEVMSQKGDSLCKARTILELVKNVDLQQNLLHGGEKRDLLEKMTSNLSVQGRNVVFTMKSPFMELANRHFSESGSLTAAHLEKCMPNLSMVATIHRLLLASRWISVS